MPQRLAKIVVEGIKHYTEPKTCSFKFKRGGMQSLLGTDKGTITLLLQYIPNSDISVFKRLEEVLFAVVLHYELMPIDSLGVV